VLEYIARVWRRPVSISTIDNEKRTVEISVQPQPLPA
jgi:hypothetical protein